MMEDIHIADGTAVKLLLAGLVLASGAVGAVGAVGLAPATTGVATDGDAETTSAGLAFPIDNVTARADSLSLSLDGKGNDPYPATHSIDVAGAAFPIDNVSAKFPIDNVSVSAPWDVRDTDPIRSVGATATDAGRDTFSFALARTKVPDELPQDMDPY